MSLHARVDVTVFIFNGQVLIFLRSSHGVPVTGPSWSSRTDSELLFHRTKLNFAGSQRDLFIIMIPEVPVRSYCPILNEHTVALDGLKKGRTNAVRVAVVVLQSVVVIRAGLKIVRDNRRAVVRKNAQEDPMQEELGLTMYAPAWCGGRRGVRLVGLARSCVIVESPFAAVVFVADDKVEGCEHGQEKSLELQESMTPVGGPFGVSDRGPLGLGREDEGLVIGHSRLLRCCSMPLRRRRAG